MIRKHTDTLKEYRLKNVLSKLNIYGWEKIEDYILSAIITEDPVILIGSTGDGKTYAIERIASFLGFSQTFQSYDASKALFDDLIGFPNVVKDKDGFSVSYAKTPLTIWDKEFVFIDEISRALPDIQNKWLEIIRNRQLMGIKLNNLKYIFAAMNPKEEYTGVVGLDFALIDRFSLFIRVPHFTDIENEDSQLIAVINDNIDMKDKDLKKLRKKIFNIKKQYEKKINDYDTLYKVGKIINKLMKSIENDTINFSINGRRLNMLSKSVVALSVIWGMKLTQSNIEKIFNKSIRYFFPFDIMYEKADVKQEIRKIKENLPTIKNTKQKKETLFELIKRGDHMKYQTRITGMHSRFRVLLRMLDDLDVNNRALPDTLYEAKDKKYITQFKEVIKDVEIIYETVSNWDTIHPHLDDNTLYALSGLWSIYCNYLFVKRFDTVDDHINYIKEILEERRG